MNGGGWDKGPKSRLHLELGMFTDLVRVPTLNAIRTLGQGLGTFPTSPSLTSVSSDNVLLVALSNADPSQNAFLELPRTWNGAANSYISASDNILDQKFGNNVTDLDTSELLP